MKNILCFGVGLLFMGMTSCYFSKLTSKRKSDFTHRLEEVSTDFLRFEGYYEFSDPAADLWKLDFHLSLKFPSSFFIFYPDGTFAADFYFYQNKTEEDMAKGLKSCL